MNNYNVLWLSGRPCSGKSTLGDELEKRLRRLGKETFRIDGDMLRDGLNYDLGFDGESRKENLRRAAEIIRLFKNYYTIVIASFITPFKRDLRMVNNIIGTKFKNIYVDCNLDRCIERDVKGMYAKALAGKIKKFTGLDSPYELPINPWLIVNTEKNTIKDCVDTILDKFFDYSNII